MLLQHKRTNRYLSVRKKGKWGVVNTSLEIVVNCEYDEKIVFDNEFALTKQNEHFVVIKNTGEIIINQKVNAIEIYANYNIISALSYETMKLLGMNLIVNINTLVFDQTGKYLFDANSVSARIIILMASENSSQKYHPKEIVPIHSDYMKYRISINQHKQILNKWGLCKRNGDVVIDACFDDIKGIGCGIITVYSHEKKLWGFADIKGNIIIDYAYEEAETFSHGVARVRPPKSRWGIIGSNGTIITGFVYEKITDFIDEECIATLSIGENKKNNVTEQGYIHYQYYSVNDNYKDDTYLSGYDWCSDVYHDLCIVQRDNLYGIIKANGKVVLKPCNLHDIKLDIVNNSIVFKKGDEFRLIDNTGGIITHTKDDWYIVLPNGIFWCEDWIDDHICVESDGKWGVLNKEFKYVLPAEFKLTQCIGGNKIFCITSLNGKDSFSIYDIPSGTFLALDYDSVRIFKDGFAIVSKCIKETKISYGRPIREYVYGLININGELVLDCTNKEIQF